MILLLLALPLSAALSRLGLQDKPVQDNSRAMIEVNGGAATTQDRLVTIKLVKPSPDAPIVEMSLSADGKVWTPWRPFAEVTKFELPAGAGEKTIYVRFSDREGKVSAPAVARITLEQAAVPEGPSDRELSSRPELFYARFKTGLWFGGPEFHARTVVGSRTLTSAAMATLNLAVGISLSDSWSVELFGEEALGRDARVSSFGAASALKVYEGPLLLGDGILEVRAALSTSDLTVTTEGFGSFDLGVGYQAGLGGSWNLAEHLWLDAEAGFRGSTNSWSGASVLTGDHQAQSLGAELMIGISYRF